MKTLVHFKKLKETLSGIQFYSHCKRMLLEKENYSKIAIQKAQQFMDGYTKPTNFYLN